MKRSIFLSLMALTLLIIMVPAVSYSHNNSSPNRECYSCHSGGNAPAFVKVKGLPEKYVPGGIYKIEVTIESENESFGEVQGGISIMTEGGEIGVNDMVNTQYSYPFVTHTKEGANSRHWTFTWRAPGHEMTAVVYIMGVAANGDFSPAGDSVTAAVIEVNP